MRSWQLQTASSRSYVSSAPAGLNKDEDTGRFHGTKKGNFHEIFNLTENERPLAGMCVRSLWPALAGWGAHRRAGPRGRDSPGGPEGSGQAGGSSGVCSRATRGAWLSGRTSEGPPERGSELLPSLTIAQAGAAPRSLP